MNLKHLGQIADSNENSETPLFSEYVQVGWRSRERHLSEQKGLNFLSALSEISSLQLGHFI